MTLTEYHRKLHSLMTSDAPIEQREQAIAELRSKYDSYSSVEAARMQIEESKPDISDIGDGQ